MAVKKGFTREYWFLLGCWALFSVLGILVTSLSSQSMGLEPLWRFQDPAAGASGLKAVLSVLSSACFTLSSAALGVIAIRCWIKPVLLAYFLLLFWQVVTLWPSLRQGGLGYAALMLLTLLLWGGITFVLAKLLYRLLKGREWAVALVLVALTAAAGLVRLLYGFGQAPSVIEIQVAPSLLKLLKDTLLSAVSYCLLLACIRKWPGAKPAAAGQPKSDFNTVEQPALNEKP